MCEGMKEDKSGVILSELSPQEPSLGRIDGSETYRAARAAVKRILAAGCVPEEHFEADQMIIGVLGISRTELHAQPDRLVCAGDMNTILELAARRAAGEPLSYILGDALFCGRRFQVTRGTLIPRPETEVMTSYADKYMKQCCGNGFGNTFADWCTGSGCIAITLLLDNPNWCAYAVDSSSDALDAARVNASLHGVEERIKFILCESPRSALSEIEPGSLDFIVTNPPYIPTGEIGSLEPQVRLYEPSEALDGGRDGLTVCRLLLSELGLFMKDGAPLIMETGGESQVRELISETGKMKFFEKFADQREIYRFMVWHKSI